MCVSDYVVDPEAKVWRQGAASTMFKHLLYALSPSPSLSHFNRDTLPHPTTTYQSQSLHHSPFKKAVQSEQGKNTSC